MYSRMIQYPNTKSFFLFGPRGTGKSTWVKTRFPQAVYIDLLDAALSTSLTAAPDRLKNLIPKNYSGWVVIDEVQRVPELLNEVHRLIEERKLRFVLTGSSGRKLRRKGVNLLAGRASTRSMHPLTAAELGQDFNPKNSLLFGHLPSILSEHDPMDYLYGYVQTYLREEVLQEGLTRNIGAFARFLEAAALSQATTLNISEIARECAVQRKTVEGYFQILEDLLLATRLPVFTRRAKRRMVAHRKFYFFDAGVYRALRPKGPLDLPAEIDGAALETMVFQELSATIANLQLGYHMYYWRTANQKEVDFVLYGERGLLAIEVKRSSRPQKKDVRGLRAFLKDYPMAKAFIFYRGPHIPDEENIEWLPIDQALLRLPELLS